MAVATRARRRDLRPPLAIGAGVAAFVLLLTFLGGLGWARWRLYDLTSRLVAASGPDRRIAIVGITDADLATYGRWPWPRSLDARLVDQLHADGARVIALDLLLTESSTAASDQALAAAARRAGNVIFAGYATLTPQAGPLPLATALEQPIAPLRAAGAVGLINAQPDADGVLRQAVPGASLDGRMLLSLDLLAVQRAGGHAARVPLLPDGDYLVSYAAPNAFPLVSVGDVLTGRVGRSLLAGRIVLVGAWAAGLGDRWLTPLGGPWPGVLVHAESIRTLLRGGIALPSVPSRVAAIAVAAVAGALLFAWLGPWLGSLALLLLALATIVWAALSLAYGVAADAAGPLAALLLSWSGTLAWRTSAEQRARLRVTALFGRHVGPDVVRSLMGTPADEAATAGTRLTVTVLFLDMRGFTALANGQQPEAVVALLNRVFDAVVPLVLGSGGMLDKFVGDGLMAVWNAPTALPAHAARAVRTALAMQQRLRELAPAGPRLGFGIGIATGDAVVGTVGTHSRQEYTAIGDTVNLAARLQENAAAGEVLVSEATWAACQTAGAPAAEPRLIAVKGRSDPVRVFALRDPDPAAVPAVPAALPR